MKTMMFVVTLTLGLSSTYGATIQTNKSNVEFLAIGKPSAIKIRGKSQNLKSQLQWKEKQLNGNFVFDLNSLDTGIELRTNHMKEQYLETGKFKNAELTLKPVALTQDICKESVQLEKIPFEGTLKLHGEEKPVKGEFDIKADKGQGISKVRFDLNITEYKIDIPVYMGIKVADKVENTVELEWTCAL